jgi:hypothetical protein
MYPYVQITGDAVYKFKDEFTVQTEIAVWVHQ